MDFSNYSLGSYFDSCKFCCITIYMLCNRRKLLFRCMENTDSKFLSISCICQNRLPSWFLRILHDCDLTIKSFDQRLCHRLLTDWFSGRDVIQAILWFFRCHHAVNELHRIRFMQKCGSLPFSNKNLSCFQCFHTHTTNHIFCFQCGFRHSIHMIQTQSNNIFAHVPIIFANALAHCQRLSFCRHGCRCLIFRNRISKFLLKNFLR